MSRCSSMYCASRPRADAGSRAREGFYGQSPTGATPDRGAFQFQNFFYNAAGGTVQVIADVAGYYTSSGGDAFVPVNPVRVMDTRSYLGGSPFDGHGLETWSVGQAGFADFAAVVMNVTVTDATAGGYLTVYPEGDAQPTASNLNFGPGQTVPNLVMTGFTPGTTGGVNFYNASPQGIDVVADMFGYFS